MDFLFRGISPLRFSFEKRIYIEILHENALASKHFHLYYKNIIGTKEFV